MPDLRAKSVPSTCATDIHLYTYRGRAYALGMSNKISIHTDHETWTGTPSELRDLFISMIPAEPNLGQLQELAAGAPVVILAAAAKATGSVNHFSFSLL
ncbi:hypothetical protein CHUV2995_01001 [Corynebacterium diphtheriae subsp. lausannense]|uniref:hypothetical protein n=1 Tax=Corynebacterium belfantii TaxID=2014537 RepID=UPI000DC1C635|nr:hypothetical protein [Corynebacterium belfantii]SPJ40213.1 hypothetical protein CHUV2995_01001 [Corynebacterium diphtheriae subsp. lausannense]